MCSYTAFWHFYGSLDGPDRTDGKVRPASGFGLRAVRGSLRSLFIAVATGLIARHWVLARMPECGILAEAGPAGQRGGTGEEPALHECLGPLTGMRCLTKGPVRQGSLLRRSTAGDRPRRCAGAETIEVPCFICSILGRLILQQTKQRLNRTELLVIPLGP